MYALVFVLVSVLVCIRMRMHVRERVRVRMRVRIRMSAAIRCSQPDSQPDSSLPPFARHVGSQAGYLAFGSQPAPGQDEVDAQRYLGPLASGQVRLPRHARGRARSGGAEQAVDPDEKVSACADF